MKRPFYLILCAALLLTLASCDFLERFGDKKETPATSASGKTAKENTTAAASGSPASQTTSAVNGSVTGTQTAETAVEAELTPYVKRLEELQRDFGNDGTAAFLYDGDENGTEELFVTYVSNGRGICTVYALSGGTTIRRLADHEIFNGAAEEYCIGIAEKKGERFLYTYSKTRLGSEYTVRYEYIGLKDMKTETVAEDYRRKDQSTGNSVHEYTVNGESCFENDYIIARESYTVKLSTSSAVSGGIEKAGKTFSDLIKEIKSKE